MKKSLFHIPVLFLPSLLVLAASSVSCNSKSSKESEDIAAVTISTVAIKSFSLSKDTKVIDDLDSVFFSIDLNNGVVFNADSLPLGTDVTHLVPVITFSSTMQKANLIISDGLQTDTINYLETKTDSIDFSKRVTLDVTSYDGSTDFTYILKVNVHTQKPDSIIWDKLAVAQLPSRLSSPKEQKTVELDETAYSIIKESDNSLTLSTSTDLFNNVWSKSSLSLPFTPDISSLCATRSALWMLDTAGNLFSSADGSSWTQSPESGWITIIGPYLDSVLGIKTTDSGIAHCHYPASDLIADPELDPEFPLTRRSPLLSLENKWSPQPTAVFVGGIKPSGEYSAATWAFDGSVWAEICDKGIPATASPVLFRYVYYRNPSVTSKGEAREIWVTFGGQLADGNVNEFVYLSADNGVTWRKAQELMQLPEYFPLLFDADALIMPHELNADLAEGWTPTKTSSYSSWLSPDYDLDGTNISWLCPYIYIFGGTNSAGFLSDSIWRGVLTRLTFHPII